MAFAVGCKDCFNHCLVPPPASVPHPAHWQPLFSLRTPYPCAVVIEGMGRAIHTNYHTKFKCDTLKLAMIKNRHLAQRLFGGDVYDCVCRFDSAQGF